MVQWIRIRLCQRRRHEFDPWSGKIPHAPAQLKRMCCQLLKPSSPEPVLGNKRRLRNEKPAHRNQRKRVQPQRLSRTKNKSINSGLDQTSETSQTCSKNLVGPQCRGILEELKWEMRWICTPGFCPHPCPTRYVAGRGRCSWGRGAQ